MAEQKTLPHEINRQDNGYYCGPAAVRVALSTRGIYVSEQELAVKLGTTTAGTASSTNIDTVMDAYIRPGVEDFAPVFVRGQDVTADEAAAFRANVVASIDAGYGVVVNVVGTGQDVDGNRYTYSGGHYVAVCGYRQSGAQMLVTDVAIGRDYWMATDALDTWMAARGYVWAAHVPAEPLPWVPATIPPGAPYPLQAGHYYGDIKGDQFSHGGHYDNEKPTVAAIQLRLIELGHVPGITAGTPQAAAWADGRYEQPTIDAVKRLQKAAGLVEDGRVGPVAWSALFPATTTPTPPPPPPPPPVKTDIQLPLATSLEEIARRAETTFLLDSIRYEMSRVDGTLDCSWLAAILMGLANPRGENTVTLLTRGHVRPITREQAKRGDIWGKLGEGTLGKAGHVGIIVGTPSTRDDGKWAIIHQTSVTAPGPDLALFADIPAGYGFYRSSAIPEDVPAPPAPPSDVEAIVAALIVELDGLVRTAVREEIRAWDAEAPDDDALARVLGRVQANFTLAPAPKE